MLHETPVGLYGPRWRCPVEHGEDAQADREVAGWSRLHGFGVRGLVAAHRSDAARPLEHEQGGQGSGGEHEHGTHGPRQAPSCGICGRDHGHQHGEWRHQRGASNRHAEQDIASRHGGLQLEWGTALLRGEVVTNGNDRDHDVVEEDRQGDDHRHQTREQRIEHLQHKGTGDCWHQPGDAGDRPCTGLGTGGDGHQQCRRDQESAKGGEIGESPRCFTPRRDPAGKRDIPRQHGHRDAEHQECKRISHAGTLHEARRRWHPDPRRR